MITFLEGVKTHLEHLEDLVFDDGADGLGRAVAVLSDIASGSGGTRLTTKFDGKPAVMFGGDEFAIGTKRFLTRPARDEAEVAEIYSDSPALVDILSGLMPKLRAAVKDNRVYIGDLMFYPGSDKREAAGEVRFKPNTIEYGVDAASDLGRLIAAADYGIVVHSVVDGGERRQMEDAAGAFRDVPGLWIGDAASGSAAAPAIAGKVEEIKRLAGSLSKRPDYFAEVVRLGGKLKRFFVNETRNAKIGGSGTLRRIMDDIASQYKTEKGAKGALAAMESPDFRRWMGLLLHTYLLVASAKDDAVAAMSSKNRIRTYAGGEPHSGEGFVATKGGGMSKLVDRRKFSALNYSNWSVEGASTFGDWLAYAEGGNAVKGASRIPRDEAVRMQSAAVAIIDRLTGSRGNAVPIGTAGKKDTSGDIDVAVAAGALSESRDKDEACEALSAALRSEGFEPVYNRGLRTVSIGMPFGDGLVGQVDFMVVTDLEWASFGYHTPDSGDDVQHGMARNVLLYELVRRATARNTASGDETSVMFSVGDGMETVRRERDAKGKMKVAERFGKTYSVQGLVDALREAGVDTTADELKTLSGVVAAAKRAFGDAGFAEIAARTAAALVANKKPVPAALKQ